MRAISGVRDPEELVGVYWDGIGELLPPRDYLALSRRNVAPPQFLITRSSRFTEHPNPWKERERLPRLTGGLLGEIAYANKPVVIDDLPSRLLRDDPGWFYLEGYQSLIALPTYDGGEALNMAIWLAPPGEEMDHALIPMMHWHSGLFGRGTQTLVLRNQLDEALEALDRELQVVGEIQRSLLPEELPAIEGFDIAAYYLTSARAGGDYYDFFPLADGEWGVFIADVSGHGTPAAVLMAVTHAIAHAQPGTHTPPAALLTYLNRQLARSYTRSGTFVTAFYAVLNPRTRRLTYSAAGHNPPRVARGGRVLSLDGAGSLPLGIMEDQEYGEATVDLERGDVLALYTDGITEAMAPPEPPPPEGSPQAPGKEARKPRELFGVGRLDEALVGAAKRGGARECIERVRAAVEEFSEGAAATDDRTLIVMRCG